MESDGSVAGEGQRAENPSAVVESTKSTNNAQPKSTVWKYMSKQGHDMAKCAICEVLLKRKNGSTTGLRKHLFQVH